MSDHDPYSDFWILRDEDDRAYLFHLSRRDFRAELAQDFESAVIEAGDLWAQYPSAS